MNQQAGTVPGKEPLGDMGRNYDSAGDRHDGSCATDSVAGYSKASPEILNHQQISGTVYIGAQTATGSG
jgi:hypothetical protein